MADGRRRRLSPEERVLWTTITKTIAPLQKSASEGPPPPADSPPAPPSNLVQTKSVAQTFRKGGGPPALLPLGRRERARIARGNHRIEGRLDLHGLTQSEAHNALLRFLRAAMEREARLVLVITGKGGRRAGESGVLKTQVPRWLSLPEFRPLVIGFEIAHAAHGGEGALYIRVRRKKRE
ncbi:MAG TPA: Smr/MutS family protein [Pseudolabrys sp.]|nr:Smr/MutS family protein [Pseudolabrys sp.]